MNLFRLLLFFALSAATHPLSAATVSDADLTASALEVDALASSSLGMNVRSLALLLDADPSSFRPKWSLEESGDFSLLKKLQADGFIVVTEHRKLPDGRDTGEAFVSYTLTSKGEAVVAGLSQK